MNFSKIAGQPTPAALPDSAPVDASAGGSLPTSPRYSPFGSHPSAGSTCFHAQAHHGQALPGRRVVPRVSLPWPRGRSGQATPSTPASPTGGMPRGAANGVQRGPSTGPEPTAVAAPAGPAAPPAPPVLPPIGDAGAPVAAPRTRRVRWARLAARVSWALTCAWIPFWALMPYLGLSLSIVVLIAGLVLGLIAQRLCRESETRALHVAAREALGEAARRAP